jgi:hypothetical protein
MNSISSHRKAGTGRSEGRGDRRTLLTSWTLQPDTDRNDPLLKEIMNDCAENSTILELFAQYMKDLKINPDNNALQLRKMAKLFQSGTTPSRVEGHHYGVPLCFKTGNSAEPFSSISNVLEMLWGITVYGQSPWVGKSFSPADAAMIDVITLHPKNGYNEAFLGVNHFNRIILKAPNNVSFLALNILMHLESPPSEEQENFGHERNGGNFIARQGQSVYKDSPRKVFQLNYRWKNLNNIPPLCWLIDELVEVARGLYLGQLLFATDNLLDRYEPDAPLSESRYQHFGYFLLFDDRWNSEARRLFPFLEIPENAPGLAGPSIAGLTGLSKFSTFTLADKEAAPCDDAVYQAVLADLKGKPTIMHLLKDYSVKLQSTSDNSSPLFSRLQEIFNRGIGIADMDGYYRGALVSWHSEGIFKLFDANSLNLVWTGLAMKFSTWTGKSFEPISKAKLAQMTGSHEKGDPPARWGANTQAMRTFKEKFVGNLTEIAQVWNEPVPGEEAIRNGYDVKNFFFIAHQAPSISVACKGKTIYQLNYRWPALKTIIPDRYCIDELVQIAEGLYLGQLMYATKVLLPYDPGTDPAAYEYRNFGFFILMDEQWHQIRLKIGFDLTNA